VPGEAVQRGLARLEGVRPNGDGWLGRCPVPGHGKGRGDVSPSLSVSEAPDGRALLRCQVGCATEDVLASAGLTWADLFPDKGDGDKPTRSRQLTVPSKRVSNETPEGIHVNPQGGKTTTPEPAPTIDPERRSEILTAFCKAALIRESATPKGHPGLAYLEHRGISPATVCKCGLGFVTDYPKADDWLLARYSLDELKASGLFSARGHLRAYKHRLLLPYWSGGRVLGLQCRDCDGGQPKELSLGPVAIPFGVDALLGEPGDIYITEGVIDALSLIEQGLAAMAIPGVSNFRREWIDLFGGWDVVLALDADPAGRAGADRIAKMFTDAGQTVRVLELPEGLDVNDYLRVAA
jgi:hypothetical protein